MKCPECAQTLKTFNRDCFVCSDGHGALIFNKHLREKDEDLVSKIEQGEMLPVSTQRTHSIACPHCGTLMHQVDYNSTGIIIDSCLKCHYRWLDRGELRKIKDHKPQLDPIDKALLISLEEKIGKVHQDEVLNPAYQLSDRSLGSPGSLGLSAIRAVYVGLRHSWFSRIATITILIIAVLVYVYVIKEFNK